MSQSVLLDLTDQERQKDKTKSDRHRLALLNFCLIGNLYSIFSIPLLKTTSPPWEACQEFGHPKRPDSKINPKAAAISGMLGDVKKGFGCVCGGAGGGNLPGLKGRQMTCRCGGCSKEVYLDFKARGAAGWQMFGDVHR